MPYMTMTVSVLSFGVTTRYLSLFYSSMKIPLTMIIKKRDNLIVAHRALFSRFFFRAFFSRLSRHFFNANNLVLLFSKKINLSFLCNKQKIDRFSTLLCPCAHAIVLFREAKHKLHKLKNNNIDL